PINTLLKNSYLLGTPQDLDSGFQTIFDIAEDIGGVDCCGYYSLEGDSDMFKAVVVRHIPPVELPAGSTFHPAAIAKYFGKAVLLDPARDPQFLPICNYFSAASVLIFPLRKERELIGALVFGKRGPEPPSPVEVKILWVLTMQAENHVLQSEAVKSLSFYSFLDPLTHLYNRRYFDNQLEKEILRSRRNGKSFSLLMLDLDGFKSYNDRFLHSSGDIALQEFAGILVDSVREVDTVCRYGGDEFAIIIVESNAEGARDLALRVVDRMRKHQLPGIDDARTERISASIGVASFPSDSFDSVGLIRNSDRALYLAKNQGGGSVCLFQEIGNLLTVKPDPNDLPIQKVYNAARSVVDMDKFLEILLFTAMQGVSAGRGSIVVTDPDGDFILRAAIGFRNGDECMLAGTSIPPGAVTSWVVEHKAPLLIPGQHDSPLQGPLKKNGYRTDSFLSIPLIHESRVLGALHLTNRKNRQPFSPEDLVTFQPIADEIAAILSQGMTFRDNIKSFSSSILNSLARALELRFPFLSGHSHRVSGLSLRAGEKLGLRSAGLDNLGMAASLHEIGIVGIPGTIMGKKQRLSEQELEIARKHPFIGCKMLEGVPGMEEVRRIILEHHEYMDGSGYPYGLKGDEISLGGRILAVAEFYDSITSERPHRGKLRHEEALQLVRNGAGTLFDPAVANLFVEDASITSH
ncbi:MAG: diguanylate cyclase, partial [Deltaproteobacteria bacterium]|nr:diguanylate cyclase [Deltaproteobacteria bacterium]